MDFILGIFTGITLTFIFGIYMYNKDKKEKEKEQAAKDAQAMMDSWYKDAWRNVMNNKTIEARIKEAVERDDFEEAARLRDLMNKK